MTTMTMTTTSAWQIQQHTTTNSRQSAVGASRVPETAVAVATGTTTSLNCRRRQTHCLARTSRTTNCQHASNSATTLYSSSYENEEDKKEESTRDSFPSSVTEDMVLEAVENAEKAWEAALEARKTANALIDRAEEEAEAASIVAQETEKMVGDNQRQKIPVTMQQLAQVDRASAASLDATSKVNRAMKASEEADRLEKVAEAALQESERMLEDHLKEFPDSSLADE
eukprot:CAMPEP_0113510734 /NCGR_PEP_ID=MMETSP0014_2-20120614/38305_1 /TAXON_ID=2857 /ORGANISM="Nitzschia sp." /LENGTH=226 /DNA_ID=CAMNT_0000406727 /DNA_START=390 /DNA_END=1070 /DNA_ORIENTATION=- /assembly_acc=CAM_ASM_000159